MAHIGIRFPDELHAQIKTHADALGISISDFIRDIVSQALNNVKPDADDGAEVQFLRSELSAVLRTAEEARKRSDVIIAKLTEQLHESHQQIEDFRYRKSKWWKFW